MKISFKKLKTTADNINVSFDNKNTFENYDKNTALTDGINIPDECTDFSNIVIKTDKSEITDLVYEIPADLLNQGSLSSKLDKRIKNLKIPEGVTSIGDNTFLNCSGLTSIIIPNSVTTIGKWAFQVCASLTNIKIPEGVTSIGYNAFGWCDRLTSIEIPSSVTHIGDLAFNMCSRLINISISANNEYYSSDEYALYNKDKTKIIEFYNQSITTFTIPDSVTSIGADAFENCSRLTSIFIPESITFIDADAFGSCFSLRSLNYRGTEEQWNNITKDKLWNYNCSATVNYNYVD